MICIGYLVRFDTAVRLFPWAPGLALDTVLQSTRFVQFAKELKRFGLEIHRTDKGQCFLGILLEELSDPWEPFYSVDDALIMILQAKKRAVDAFTLAGADLSDLELQPMEGEPVRVHNPPPYLVSLRNV